MKTGASASQQCCVTIEKLGYIDKGNGKHESNEVINPDGLAPTICAGHGVKYWINHVEVKKMNNYAILKQDVKVRKHQIDNFALCDLLRKSKAEVKLNNKEIAKTLNVPKTNVEHWFRRDECFSIPDAEIWFKLKELLHIKTDKYDAAVTEFETKEGVFDKAERVYLPDCCAPTLDTGCGDVTGIEVKKLNQQIVAMRGRNTDNPSDRTAGIELEQRLEPNSKGVSNTITSVQKDNLALETVAADALRMVRTEEGKRLRKDYESGRIMVGFNEHREPEPRKDEVSNTLSTVQKDNLILEQKKIRIRQATKDGFIDCEIPGLVDLNYTSSVTRRGRVVRGGANISNTDNGEYP